MCVRQFLAILNFLPETAAYKRWITKDKISEEQATSASTGFHVLIELEFGVLVFSGGRKLGEPGEKPSEQGENQQHCNVNEKS